MLKKSATHITYVVVLIVRFVHGFHNASSNCYRTFLFGYKNSSCGLMDKAPDLAPGDAGSNPAMINVF